jgi:hypothetical protein
MNMDDILVSLEIFSVAPLAVAAVDWRRWRRSTQNKGSNLLHQGEIDS